MSSVCFYFQVHQPYRVRRYSYFEVGKNHEYFDEPKNAEIIQKVAKKCYLPANYTMLELINKFQGRFRISYSISGVAIEQMQKYAPEALDSFIALSKTGCVEFLAETYYHSLASVFNPEEFKLQVQMQEKLIQSLFNQKPKVFRNTELVYSDPIGKLVQEMGYRAMLAEGADDILGWRSPNFVYNSSTPGLKLLLKNYKLSDDIAFRFSNRSWAEFPLNAPKFANWVHRISGNGEVLNLFMDYETFGEHQWECTGIFEFLRHLPEAIFQHPHWDFKTPSEVLDAYTPIADMPFYRLVSWADIDRDLTAWEGNNMQRGALRMIYEIGEKVKRRNNAITTDLWRKLQTSDHFYYMCTKWFADGDVHAYFSPYKSPYEAYINYMNALSDFRQLLDEKAIAPMVSEIAKTIKATQTAEVVKVPKAPKPRTNPSPKSIQTAPVGPTGLQSGQIGQIGQTGQSIAVKESQGSTKMASKGTSPSGTKAASKGMIKVASKVEAKADSKKAEPKIESKAEPKVASKANKIEMKTELKPNAITTKAETSKTSGMTTNIGVTKKPIATAQMEPSKTNVAVAKAEAIKVTLPKTENASATNSKVEASKATKASSRKKTKIQEVDL